MFDGFDAPATWSPVELPSAWVAPSTTVTMRLATLGYFSRGTDAPAHTGWTPRIIGDVEISLSALDMLGLGGRVALVPLRRRRWTEAAVFLGADPQESYRRAWGEIYDIRGWPRFSGSDGDYPSAKAAAGVLHAGMRDPGRDRAITAISARAAAAAADIAASSSYRRAARAAPVSNACAGSPAVGGYLGGLRAAQPAPTMVLPPALRQWRPEPAPPAELASDADLVEWIEDLRTAGADCRSVVAAVAGMIP